MTVRARSALALAALALALVPQGARATAGDWPVYGLDLSNSRHQTAETQITEATAPNLTAKWFFKTGRDVTGTPIVAAGTVFFGDTGGSFYAVDAASGRRVWSRTLRGPMFGTAAYSNGRVIAGDNGGWLHAFDAATGATVWSVHPETDPEIAPFAQFWGSPVPHDGRIYIGLAGEDKEVTFSLDRKVWRGSVVAVNESNGATVWHTYVVPKVCKPGTPNGDRCNGGSVWSTAAIDPARNLAYWGTGNAYGEPAHTLTDAMLGVNLTSGAIEWAHQFTENDSWSHTPEDIVGSPDWDFGSSPILFDVAGTAVVGEGQKSGDFRVVRRDTGATVWERHHGGGNAGGFAGGFLASPALADGRIYATATDPVADTPVPTLSRHMAFASQDGDMAWANPTPVWAWSAPAVANGVVFVGSTIFTLYAYDADTGATLWQSDGLGGIVASGPSISNGRVYVGVGCCGGESENSGVWSFGL